MRGRAAAVALLDFLARHARALALGPGGACIGLGAMLTRREPPFLRYADQHGHFRTVGPGAL